MSKKGKKILISGYIGFGNFGDEAVLSCLVAYLKSKNADITVLSNMPQETQERHLVKSVKFNSFFALLGALMSCQVLFSGGGSLLQNNTSNKSLIYYLLVILFAKLMGKKVVIFAQGMEGIHGKIMSGLTKKILEMCNLITVRDEISQKLMNAWKLRSVLVCDPVYSIKLPSYTPKKYVGIQLRSCKDMHPLFGEHLADAVGKFFKDNSIKIFSFQDEYDRRICLEFAMLLQKKYQNLDVEVILNPTIPKIITDFANLEYLVAMRYHACILGTMYGIKTLPIVYDDKILSLAKKAKLPYINCGWEDDLISHLKDLENSYYKTTRRFAWNIYDKFVC